MADGRLSAGNGHCGSHRRLHGDQLSYKRLFVLALLGFTLSSLLCVVAWNIETLIAFRITQGVFGGMIIPITMTIIYQVFPGSGKPTPWDYGAWPLCWHR